MSKIKVIKRGNSKKCIRCRGKGKESTSSSSCKICGGVGRYHDTNYHLLVETAEGTIGFDVDNPGK